MLIGDTTITVGQATRKNYTVTVPGTQNQIITLKYTDSNTGIEHTETISTLDRTFSIPYMSSFTASVNGTNGYLPGTLSNTSGDISTDLTITVSPARKYYNKELFKTAGTTSWICPTFISKVHIVIAGAGGGAHSEEIEESSQRMVYINGGNVVVDGPTNNGNGALDSGLGFIMNGGTAIAVGSSGMAETFGSSSTVYNVSIYLSTTMSAESKIEFKDSAGETILEHTSAKQFTNIAAASPEFKKGETYSLYINGVEKETFTINCFIAKCKLL
jgi:hypothetical protein